MKGEMMQKEKTFRSKRYMDFVKTLDCCVSSAGCGGEIAAHHTETGGMGIKGSDLSCIPLCGIHHAFYHNSGKITFASYYNINIQDLVEETIQKRIDKKA